VAVAPGAGELVGELHDQDAVLGDQADQCQQTDLRVDVQGHRTHGNRQHGAEDRQGYGHEDHQGVAEAVELRREHQEYQQQGQGKQDRERRALLHVAPRGPV
jgi:hypothetical protein